ncbi:MAG: hypothetical protein ACFFB3_08945 [Candidatus Hodarchaeota archaeon]
MAQRKEMSSEFDDLADIGETISIAQEQLSQSLINIVKHLQRLSKSGILAEDRIDIEKTINMIISNEFKVISAFLTQALWNNIVAIVEENERLSSRIQKLRPELLETETERDRYAQKSYDFEQDNKLLRKQLKQLSESAENLLTTIQTLKTVEKEYEAVRSRLKTILETSDADSLPQQVDKLVGLLLKAGYKIQQDQQRRSKLEEEAFRLRKTYEAVSILSEHDPTSRMIIILAEMGEMEVDRLAEITGQKKILLRYQLKKWANRGLVRLSNDGNVVSLVQNDEKSIHFSF